MTFKIKKKKKIKSSSNLLFVRDVGIIFIFFFKFMHKVNQQLVDNRLSILMDTTN